MLRFFYNKAISRTTSSVILTAFLISTFLMPMKAWALTSGPSQPESAQFAPAGTSEMVNLFTGDFNYNIPLLDVEGYPINIAYNANINMEDESSWVGLGWSLNPGSINRSLRGMPDDFKGDVVRRRIGMRDYTSYGGMIGYDVELSGKNTSALRNLSTTGSIAYGASFNNYRGWGAEFAFDFGLGANFSKESGLGLAAGLGLGFKSSTLDGASFAPSFGLSASYRKEMAKTGSKWGGGVGVNFSPAINSRSGVWDRTWSASISASYSKKNESSSASDKKDSHKGRGIGMNFSVFIPASSLAFSPQIPYSMKSNMWAADIKVGSGTCKYAVYGTLRGYFSNTKVADNDLDYKAYGYLNEGMANKNRVENLLDFSREKDGTTYKESTNLPLTSHNYDLFSMTSQGLSGAFRAHRNDIGTVYDPKVTTSSGALSFSGEIAFGDGVNVGGNILRNSSSGESGYWNSELQFATQFRNEEETKAGIHRTNEISYFSFAGEKTITDKVHKQLLGGEAPIHANLNKVSRETYKTSANYLLGNGVVNTSSASFDNANILARKPRNISITQLSAGKAKNLAFEPKIRNYWMNSFSLHPTVIGNVRYFAASGEMDRDAILSSVANVNSSVTDHISEITSTDASGSRYVYGIPVYNLYQKDVTFSTEASPDGNGHVSYVNENGISSNVSVGNGKGRDGFIESTITPAYAFSYLLTSVLSADYVDRTGNGPTLDDYGTYVKFNYSRVGDVAWRAPMTSASNKAVYNEGFYSDSKDNKASYSYGLKQRWYLHSVETKNYVAFFQLSDRDDATGPQVNSTPNISPFSEESSGAQSNSSLSSGANPLQANPFGGIQNNQKQKKLDKIILYNKQDLIYSVQSGVPSSPIKIVNFSYDYSLCKGVPNQINSGQGKLTLKKIWFSYGSTPSTKGSLSPYEFAYNDQANHDLVEDTGSNNANFNYNPKDLDRWGNYKPTGTFDNIKFPYVYQSSKVFQDLYSRAWCLNTIVTPSGGVLKIDYESDDYAHVMEKRAGQMFGIMGFANTVGGVPSNKLFNPSSLFSSYQFNNFLVVNIATAPSGIKDALGNDIYGIPDTWSATKVNDYVYNHYMKGLDDRLFFKTKVQLTGAGNSTEFVSGFADIQSVTAHKSLSASSVYDRLYIQLKPVPSGDKQNNLSIHPVTKAALQLGRKYLSEVMYPDFVASGSYTPLDYIQQLAGTFREVAAMIQGVNKKLMMRGYCRFIDASESFVRLTNPNMKKMGGGNRVKRLCSSDSWNSMIAAESSSSYTQEYDYSVVDASGRNVSSGVASYEPLLGGDENPYRVPILQAYKSSLSTNDELMLEQPVGESFIPGAVVGYSKVSVKNVYDNPAGTTVKRHGTGRTEYQFYTSRDFPVLFTQSNLNSRIVSPKKIVRLLKLRNKEKLYATQGYVIKLNDMHGQQKSIEYFAENSVAPISGVRYEYKRNGNELANTVDVIDANNTITSEEVGVDMDVINDSRMSNHKVRTFSGQVNVAVFACSSWIPLIFVSPGFSKIENQFYSIVTTKTIHKYGLVDRVIAFDNNSVIETENTLYDKESGEVVVTKTSNQYDDPVYNLNYPAHWAYSGMGGSYRNGQFKFVHTSANPVINSNGQVTANGVKSLLHPGDEVAIFDATQTNGYYIAGSYKGQKYWVVKDLVSGSPTYNELYLLDATGTKASLSGDLFCEITRSGRRNQQNVPMGAISALANPRSGNGISLSAATKIIGSSAVEFDDKWNYYGSYVEAKDASLDPCVPVYTNLFTVYQKLLNCAGGSFNTSSTYPAFGNCRVTPLFRSYNQQSPGNPVNSYLSCNITAAEFNGFLTSIGFPSTSSYPNTQGNHVRIYLVISENTFTNNLEIQVVRQNAAYTFDYVDVGGPVISTCKVILSRVTPPAANSNNQLYNAVFSNVTTNIPGKPNNLFQVTANMSFYNAPTYTGIYEGSVPCGSLFSGCTNVGCANSIPGKVNPYFENIRGNYGVKRSYSYLGNRQTGITQVGGNMKGDVRNDGVYTSFSPFWNYVSGQGWKPIYTLAAQTTNPNGIFDNWVVQSEVNKMDVQSNVLQTQNGLKRPAAALYGYNFMRQTAGASDALYTDIAFDGFEDYNYVRNVCIEHFKFTDYPNYVSNTMAHTGRYSLNVGSTQTVKVKGKLNANAPSYSETQNRVLYSSGSFANYDLTQDKYVAANSSGLYWLKEEDLAGRFGPLYGQSKAQTYVMSVWVRINGSDVPNVTDYSGFAGARFKLNGSLITVAPPRKSGLINGWQKLDYTFTIPPNALQNQIWEVELYNTDLNYDAFFDDIRIHPFNSSMVSTVYDPVSLRLWAELDDRNYATYYEYDEEGTLVRTKKETERGMFTVKEVRSSPLRR